MLGYKLYKYSIIILEIEDAIEKSIDVLNERYESMEKILQKEVFFDSIEVRQVINDIKVSQDSVYYVSLILMGEKSIEKNIED
tara:strand:+ start:764 stop:1012 length:249 start_codon:yes stop_codon:yes gene_type:complete